MLSVRTFRFGSDSGSSLSHLLKARTARVDGICWASHGFSVVVPNNKEDGSKPGGAGGAGLLEFLMRACWMGVGAGLEAEVADVVAPVGFGVG